MAGTDDVGREYGSHETQLSAPAITAIGGAPFLAEAPSLRLVAASAAV